MAFIAKSLRRKDNLVVRNIYRYVLVYPALLGLSFVFMFPFAWLVSTSLKPDPQIFTFPPIWIPSPIKWVNYPRALTYIPYLKYFLNTLFISAANVLGTIISCSLVAYGFSRIPWKGRDAAFIVVLSTMMLPYQVTMIPLYIVFVKVFGWGDSFYPLIVPSFFGSAFFIFLLRQFFMTIPLELSDAAKIDGCSEGGIYWRIIIPLSKPALATVGLFTFMFSWNDFLGPLIYLSDENTYTLSLGLAMFRTQRYTEWSMLMAASTVMTVPIIFLFFFTQRTFIQGITMTGVKG